MYLSCLCDPQLQVSHLLHCTLDMFVACCKIRGWNIICIARKKIRYKSMLFFSLSLAIRWTSWLSSSRHPTDSGPGFMSRLHRRYRRLTHYHGTWFFFIFLFLFYFTLRHRSRATLRANRGKAAGRTGELEGRKQEGVTDLTEGVCLKCKQSGAHRGC